MEIQRYPLSNEHIFGAETERSKGHIREAIRSVEAGVDFPIAQFPSLSQDEQTKHMMASRIWVVARISEANRSWKGIDVANTLSQTREKIINIYQNPNVQRASTVIQKDTKGNPYEFNTEMARDEVSYTLTLAALTGNIELLSAAVEKMDSIISRAQEPTARTVALFQKDRINHRSNPSKDSFASLKNSYHQAIQASLAIGRFERVSTVAAWYSIEAAKRLNLTDSLKGVATCVKAALTDHSTTTILPRQIIRETTESVKRWNWRRTTPKHIDYSALKLP